MLKTLLFIFIISFTSQAFSCVVQGPEVLVVFNKNVEQSLDYQGCSNKQISSVNEFLTVANGSITSSTLSNYADLRGIKLVPSNIRIRHLEDIIIQRLNFSDNKQIKILTSTISNSLLKLDSSDFLDVSCSNCDVGGHQSIKVQRKSTIGQSYTQWLKVNVLTATKVLVSRHRLNIDYKNLKPSDFIFETRYVEDTNLYEDNKESLIFKRLNRNIKKGEALLSSNLTNLQIVKFGTPAKVQISHNGISLKTVAMPMQSGFIGDTIKLKNDISKKFIYGKITGINEVSVDL